MSPSRALRGVLLVTLAGVALGLSPVAPVAAASSLAEFGDPVGESSFTTGVRFSQPVSIHRTLARVELLLTIADADGSTVISQPVPTGTGARILTYLFDPAVDGHLPPNTPLVARWRLIGVDGPDAVELGPEVRVTYSDDRFEWRTEAGALVRVHWYEGSDAFGARALKIGQDAVREVSNLLQVTESDPIDFYIYADQAAFYDALGPGTRENVGGQANAEIRTLFALISPTDIDLPWVGTVIPHELTHLVLDTAADNPYHFPPRWLNEGLAVYLSQGYDASDRGAVEAAAISGALIPLDGLTGEFPTSYERFSLAYAESVSAVEYFIRIHGQDALVSLIRSYAVGRSDDEAFGAALGVDTSAFGAAWLEDLGAAVPTRYGPQPAPPGPVPSAWLVDMTPSSPPEGTGPTEQTAASPPPGGDVPPSDAGASLALVSLVGALAVLLVLAGLTVRRRRGDHGSPG